jgi:DNA-binding PadR family transcriptional regulator
MTEIDRNPVWHHLLPGFMMIHIVGGKVRTSYSITDEGKRALAEAKETIGERVEEVVEGEGPASLPNVEAAHSEGNHNEL